VNPKIAGKWMFIPLELIIIGFDPPPIYPLVNFHIDPETDQFFWWKLVLEKTPSGRVYVNLLEGTC